MKLIAAVVQDQDAAKFVSALIESNFRVTIIASSGGLLRAGNSTLISGVEDWRVPRWLEVARENCRLRVEPLILSGDPDLIPWYSSNLIEVEVGGANVFILDVERFERL